MESSNPRNEPRPAVAVVGCGLMGCDIAAIFLAAGWRVVATSAAVDRWSARRDRVRQALDQIEAEDTQAALERFRLHAELQSVDWTGVELAIESVPEDIGIKRGVFAALDRLAPPDIPLATNTSGLRITDIARDCATRERMAGLHFFLPAHLVPAIEVVKGEHTCQATCDRLHAIMRSVGRMPVHVARDVPGFLANRIQHALMREAFAVIEEGLGTPEDVDIAVRFGFGFRYLAAGPILQKELAGLDTQLAAARAIYPSLSNASEPSRMLSKLVAEGRVGIKTGRGFWSWTADEARERRERYERTLRAGLRILRQDTPRADGIPRKTAS